MTGPDVAALCAGIRRRRGLTQQEMAARIGLSRSSIANIEAGRQDMPAAKLLSLLATEGLLVDADHPDRTIADLAGRLQVAVALLRAAEDDNDALRHTITAVRDLVGAA
jgi:transcriptional regulator with XRE-family HTH domain